MFMPGGMLTTPFLVRSALLNVSVHSDGPQRHSLLRQKLLNPFQHDRRQSESLRDLLPLESPGLQVFLGELLGSGQWGRLAANDDFETFSTCCFAAHLGGQECGHQAAPDRHHHQHEILLFHGCQPLGDKVAHQAARGRGVRPSHGGDETTPVHRSAADRRTCRCRPPGGFARRVGPERPSTGSAPEPETPTLGSSRRHADQGKISGLKGPATFPGLPHLPASSTLADYPVLCGVAVLIPRPKFRPGGSGFFSLYRRMENTEVPQLAGSVRGPRRIVEVRVKDPEFAHLVGWAGPRALTREAHVRSLNINSPSWVLPRQACGLSSRHWALRRNIRAYQRYSRKPTHSGMP